MGGHDPLLSGGVLQSLVQLLARLHVGQRRLHVPRRPKIREEPSEGEAELRFGAEGFYVCEDLGQLECKDGRVYANADRFEWGTREVYPGTNWTELFYRISYLKRKRDKRLLAWFVSEEDGSEDGED